MEMKVCGVWQPIFGDPVYRTKKEAGDVKKRRDKKYPTEERRVVPYVRRSDELARHPMTM